MVAAFVKRGWSWIVSNVNDNILENATLKPENWLQLAVHEIRYSELENVICCSESNDKYIHFQLLGSVCDVNDTAWVLTYCSNIIVLNDSA